MKANIKEIYYDRNIDSIAYCKARAQKIIAKYPDAKVIKVNSHWGIPQLANSNPEDWLKRKQEVLVLGIKKQLKQQDNGRSSDYIAVSHANGCLASCSYCYVARRKAGSNPTTVFLNIKEIADSIEEHQRKLGPKPSPNQCDPHLWAYDIGNTNDCSLDALFSSNPLYLVKRFAGMEHAKATFATKFVNEKAWLSVDPRDSEGVTHTRIRYSLMPKNISKVVDIRTSKISDRIRSVNNLVDAGYEVHLNFSPVVIYPGWKKDWKELWEEIDDVLTDKAKAQLACEVIFLTHSQQLHELNLKWHPKAEDYLWQPDLQQAKANKPDVICYNYGFKGSNVKAFTQAINKHLPYCKVRYAF